MNYEERYNKALERARKLHSEPTGGTERIVCEQIFPELVESTDERIKREIIEHLRQDIELEQILSKERGSDWIAWLEKQGEQKEINLVEILKHFPRETELYSPLYGKLWLAEVDEEHGIITCYKYRLDEGCTRATLEQENTVSFYSNGTTGLPDCTISKDCMLFLYDIEKQGECNPYSGTFFNYNGHTWGMCARDNGVDILLDEQLFMHLEKLSEQNLTDKVGSKFKVGDWLQYRSAEPFLVEEITEQGYINGNSCLPFEWENEIHLWTIEDAKDGDVLVDVYGNIGIFEKRYGVNWHTYCYLGFEGCFISRSGSHGSICYPATKKEKDYLFQKMGESGYIWDDHAKMLICSTNMESK